MALIDEYAAARDDAFGSKVIAALWGEAVTYLTGAPTPDPSVAADARKIRLARNILSVEIRGARVVINALASSGLDASSTDTAIETAITNNWDALALLFDVNVTA